MKKTFVAALAALALVSCSKEETVTYGTNGEPLDGAAVCLTFTDAPASRASLNSTAAAETWEKSLTSLTVYVFNSQGNLVAQRSFTSEELADKSATFALPHSAAGTTCDFYAVANLSLTGVTTKSALLSKVEASAADYNGTFAEVSTKAKRAGGFVMSASASKSIAEGSTNRRCDGAPPYGGQALRADHDRCGLRGEIFGNDHRHGRQALESGESVACHRPRNSFARRDELYPYTDRHRRSGQIRPFCLGKPAVQLYRDCAWACSGAALVPAGAQKRAHGYRKRAAVMERNGI